MSTLTVQLNKGVVAYHCRPVHQMASHWPVHCLSKFRESQWQSPYLCVQDCAGKLMCTDCCQFCLIA